MRKTALLILSIFILCTACAAQASEKDLPVFTSVRDAVDSTEGYAVIRDCSDYIVLILEMDGRYIRMVTLLDDPAKDLFRTMESEDFSTAAVKSFEDYAWALPLSCSEELPEAPKSQAELDALKGKTVQELMDEGFGEEMILTESELENPVTIHLENGFYSYQFEVANGASGDSRLMTIISGKFCEFSRASFDINIQ